MKSLWKCKVLGKRELYVRVKMEMFKGFLCQMSCRIVKRDVKCTELDRDWVTGTGDVF